MRDALGVGVPDEPRQHHTLAARSDVLVIGAFCVMVAGLGFSRGDFIGDGLRHLPSILARRTPMLGEPRWLFFPALLFALLRPFVALGVVGTVEGLTRPMLAATVLCAAGYLAALRVCLAALGLPAQRRAAGLAVAALTPGLLVPASNLMEPLFAATLALAGLAFLAQRAADPQASEQTRRRAVIVAVATIAAASLFYQGVILGVGLIPIFAPRRAWLDRRTLIISAVIVVAVPVITVGTLALAGNSAGRALGRFTQGEENPLYRSFQKKTGLGAYAVALFGGPPQAMVLLPEFRGFNGLIAALRSPGQRREAAAMVARLGFGLALVGAGLLAALRRRDFTLLLGFGALLLLPLVRHQQYGYVKYYVLFPVLVAIAAARAPTALAWAMAAVLLFANGGAQLADVRTSRRLRDERAPVYARADARSCWMTMGWGPAVGFLWPGSVSPVLGSLAGGAGEDPTQVVAGAHTMMTRRIADCFCGSSHVYTDDMVAGSEPVLDDLARHFQYTDFDLERIVIRDGDATVVSAGAPPVYEYSEAAQRRVCALASAAR